MSLQAVMPPVMLRTFLKTVRLQQVDGFLAAGAGFAVGDDIRFLIEFVQTLRQVAQGDQAGTGYAAI